MKKLLLVTVGLAMLGSVASAAEIKWAKSLDEAVATAKKTHRLVMIDFYTDWCGWCKKLDKDTYTDPKIVAMSEKFVPVKVNAEKEGVAVAKKYKVTGYPTIVFIDADGNAQHTTVGYMPPSGFGSEMEMSLLSADLPKMTAQVAKNPKDTSALGNLAVIYASQGKQPQMLDMLSKLRQADPANASGQVSRALNAVGDNYQNGQQLGKAVQYFEEAAKIAKKPDQKAYALISAATCYMGLQQPDKATPALEALLKMGPAAKEYADMAHSMLTAAKAAKQ